VANKQLKILYINLGDNAPYTYDKIVGRVSTWANKGHEVTILIAELSRKLIEKELTNRGNPEIRIITLPFSNKIANSPSSIIVTYMLRILFSPKILLENNETFDLCFSNSAFLVDAVPVFWLKLFGKCKDWILIMDSVVPRPKDRSGSLIINAITYIESMLIGKLANYLASSIFTVNPELKSEMVKRGIDQNKILLSQNGLFIKDIISTNALIQNNYDAIYMGRISANKGIEDLIITWKEVVKTIPDAKLAIMGRGLDKEVTTFKKKSKDLDLENNIIFLDFTPGVKKYQILKSSKVFLYLSKVNADESWGISLMEALACGLPAISYNLPIYKHIYHTNSLVMIPKNETGQVAQCIVELLKDEKTRKSLGNKAKRFAKNFDWQKIASNDLNLVSK